MKFKFSQISPVIGKLNVLYNDRELNPNKKLSLIKFMKELIVQMEEIATISNEMYLRYAIKGKDNKIIKHPFDINHVRNQTFKDSNNEVIFIPITGKENNYSIELQYQTYLSIHKDACAFMDSVYTTSNSFSLKTNEVVNYRFSAADIEFLSEVGIVNDSAVILEVPSINVVKN